MSFSLELAKFAEEATENAEETIRGVAIALFTAIINDTPVDAGRARGNWFGSGTQASSKVTTKTDKAGAATVSAMTSKIKALSNIDIIQLTNNLPYIKKLEDGYSKKAPAGMVKVNITRFESLLAEEARKRKI